MNMCPGIFAIPLCTFSAAPTGEMPAAIPMARPTLNALPPLFDLRVHAGRILRYLALRNWSVNILRMIEIDIGKYSLSKLFDHLDFAVYYAM